MRKNVTFCFTCTTLKLTLYFPLSTLMAASCFEDFFIHQKQKKSYQSLFESSMHDNPARKRLEGFKRVDTRE